MSEGMAFHDVYLGLGANIGDRAKTLAAATDRIGELVGEVVGRSALYETEPWGFESDHMFVNSVVHCRTALSPRQVLEQTQLIER